MKDKVHRTVPLCTNGPSTGAIQNIASNRVELSVMASGFHFKDNQCGGREDALRRALMELQASHEELKTAQLQLIQAEKMECIGTLAAGVAHEVKNPLQTILMGVEYLARNLSGEDDSVQLAITDIKDAVKRADAIVRDLLALSSDRQLEIKEQCINTVLEHSLCFVNYELTRSRVLVERELARDLPLVPLDKSKMEQVFINLFMNAIQAMAGGGTLILRSRRAFWNESASKRVWFQPGDSVVVVEVDDTGCGVPREKLPRIFEPFFTTKPSGVGTGLGLPVSKQIIDLHRGTIKIAPRPGGRGMAVTIILKAKD